MILRSKNKSSYPGPMSMDPARLARIRARVLAAAAIATAGCGQQTINEHPNPPIVNEPAKEPTPINEKPPEPAPVSPPPEDPTPVGHHINTPNPNR
jgi:hypothetical protein